MDNGFTFRRGVSQSCEALNTLAAKRPASSVWPLPENLSLDGLCLMVLPESLSWMAFPGQTPFESLSRIASTWEPLLESLFGLPSPESLSWMAFPWQPAFESLSRISSPWEQTWKKTIFFTQARIDPQLFTQKRA